MLPLVALNASAVTCKIKREDGGLVEIRCFVAFAGRHWSKIGTFRDLIVNRSLVDHLVENGKQPTVCVRAWSKWWLVAYQPGGWRSVEGASEGMGW